MKDKQDVVSVTKIVHNNKYFTPVLVNFENGTLLKERSEQFKVDLYEDERDGSKRTVSVYNEGELYEGNILQNENSLCQKFILLRNKKTNKVRLIETDQANVKKVFHDSIFEGNLANEKTDHQYTRNDLSKKFGSKKSIRATELGQRMKINSEIIKNQLETTVADVTVDKDDLKAVTAEQSLCNCLPPCNRSATDIKQVYSLEDIFTKIERDSVEEEAKKILAEPPDVNNSRYSFYFNMLFQKMGSSVKLLSVQCLLYADCIVKFLKTNPKDLKKRDIVESICPYSELVGNKILDTFTLRGRVVSSQLRDKAICYLVVITLLAWNYQVNLDLLSQSVGCLGLKKMVPIARAVGLSPKTKDIWQLKIPLPEIPTFYFNKRSQKKR